MYPLLNVERLKSTPRNTESVTDQEVVVQGCEELVPQVESNVRKLLHLRKSFIIVHAIDKDNAL